MARQELHSNKLPTEQKPPISDDPSSYDGDIITGERIASVDADYLADLAMNEEPVTIRLEPSSDKNAATSFPIWVNGKRAEVFQNGRWEEIGYLPVGCILTVKRKVLEVIIRAKTDTVHTKVQEMESERPNNVIQRFTSPVHSFSVLEDANPRGAAWVAELRRRNY
jgi:hypothetical protein